MARNGPRSRAARTPLYAALGVVLLTTAGALSLPSEAPSDTEQRLRKDVTRLASDAFAGRPAGEEGGRRAAAYLIERLRAAGVAPYGDPDPDRPGHRLYRQRFSFTAGVEADPACSLVLGLEQGPRRLALDEDFRPLGFSSDDEVSGEVVFAGYGITAKSKGWDDYAGLDAKGKIVLVLDGLPGGGKEGSPLGHALVRYAQVRYKAMNAREHGAVGMLVVASEPAEGGEDPPLVSLSRRAAQGNAGIACADLRRSIATGWKSSGGESVEQLQQRIDTEGKPASAPLVGVTARMHMQLVKERRESTNIIARIEGADPQLRDQVIVVGAHYDHLGDGSMGGSLADKPGIHHGADDNASGCAAVLEIARRLRHGADRPRHSVLLIFFSAEELGLLGSAHYVRHPVVPLEKTIAMVNLDMVGRLRKDRLTVGGAETSPAWKELIPQAARGLALHVTPDPEGFGPSDHSSFYGKKVPVLFLFTGAHPDYHKPSDTADKVNYAGLATIVRYGLRLVHAIDTLPARPAYAKTRGNPHASGTVSGRGPSVYLGTIPDYADTEVRGVRLQGVREGSPAARAGLQAGDVVVRFDGKEIRDVYDYTYALFAKKPGDRVEIVVERDGKRVTLHAVMGRKGGKHKGSKAHPHPAPASGAHPQR